MGAFPSRPATGGSRPSTTTTTASASTARCARRTWRARSSSSRRGSRSAAATPKVKEVRREKYQRGHALRFSSVESHMLDPRHPVLCSHAPLVHFLLQKLIASSHLCSNTLQLKLD